MKILSNYRSSKEIQLTDGMQEIHKHRNRRIYQDDDGFYYLFNESEDELMKFDSITQLMQYSTNLEHLAKSVYDDPARLCEYINLYIQDGFVIYNSHKRRFELEDELDVYVEESDMLDTVAEFEFEYGRLEDNEEEYKALGKYLYQQLFS